MWIFEFSLGVGSTELFGLATSGVLSVLWKTSTSESVLFRAVLPQISPALCTHLSLIDLDSTPSREPQHRLNNAMREVVKKEVLKLLHARIIYLVPHSEWVSPVQIMPKKGCMIVIKNKKNELIPQRTVTGWWICIDYRKLNKATKKDHFPLLFIDEMLEQLANHSFFCFLDEYLG